VTSDRGGLLTTLTKGEYDLARNGSTPAPRRCEVCSAPLTGKQKRVCGPRCASALGRQVQEAKRANKPEATKETQRPAPSAPVVPPAPAAGLPWLDTLPAEVLRLELVGGWVLSRRD
jgi:hypothetical protein